jgi:hypothetical protein
VDCLAVLTCWAYELDQPWRCLCLALAEQMTMTRRLRRMTRHLSQIGLTLGLTFTALVPGSCA